MILPPGYLVVNHYHRMQQYCTLGFPIPANAGYLFLEACNISKATIHNLNIILCT